VVETLKRTIRQRHEELMRAVEDIAAKVTEVTGEEQKIDLRGELASAERARAEQIDKLGRLSAEVDALTHQNEELVSRTTLESEARAEEVAALKRELASARAAHAQLAGEVSGLEGSLEKMLFENRSLVTQATEESEPEQRRSLKRTGS
jgi:chromosome segregation ATPase